MCSHEANINRFNGLAGVYDEYRPKPPAVVPSILIQLLGAQPERVVDLGSGTGLSTFIWAQQAREVIGIEPNQEMREYADGRRGSLSQITFRDGTSSATGLADSSVDIVTCSQALHWMEPEPTFAEVHRLLRPGGIFAAYDCDWPPTITMEVEEAYQAFTKSVDAIESNLEADPVRRWSKEGHLDRMRECGHFRFIKEVVLHSIEWGNAQRVLGIALSQGGANTLLQKGVSEAELGLTKLREVVGSIGEATIPLYFSYRMRLGVK